MKKHLSLLLLMGVCCWFAAGCGGGSDNKTTSAGPVPTVDLSGTIVVPDTVNSLLLAAIAAAQNTDSEVRNAFASASVWVNDVAASNRVISPSAVDSKWDIRILGVPQSSTGIYKVQVLAGKLGLKSWVSAAAKDAFTINSQTTGAALLADNTGMDAEGLLATFPAMVSRVAKELETAFNASTTVITSSVFAHPDVVAEVASQGAFLKGISGYDSSVKVAYLGLANDLDGDGSDDLLISQTVDRTGIRLYTPLSEATSLYASGATLASYPDADLLNAFVQGNTRTDRTFDAAAQNAILGLYFARSSLGDRYLKLLLRRVDLKEGTFSGVLAEYDFLTATGTAIASGSKTLALTGTAAATGTVFATDFLSDGVATAAGLLAFVDAQKGLGAPDGTTRIIRAIDGQPALANLSSAEPYNEYGAGYYANAQAALQAINKTRTLAVGDVFSAYFSTTRHYALLKVTALASDSVSVDYVVNSARDEPKF